MAAREICLALVGYRRFAEPEDRREISLSVWADVSIARGYSPWILAAGLAEGRPLRWPAGEGRAGGDRRFACATINCRTAASAAAPADQTRAAVIRRTSMLR